MSSPKFELPAFRRLRVYAFDPSLALRLQTLDINEITLRVPWDGDPETGKLARGPVGEYLEVVDVDPSSCVAYPPVDLDDPSLLAQDGFTPSEGNPQFHQQMVYAVAMATIMRFERALGRVALWAPRWEDPWQSPTDQRQDQFVRRLRLYPHALRERNAYYSQERKAILFGYFPVQLKDANNTPGTTVFTCLSYDIVAHEVTHALLDGIHPRFSESTNPDALAFHEAFADIVALLQRFSYPEVLQDQIARTRGRLDTENLLAELAQQFGRATGHGGALRDALGEEEDGVWNDTNRTHVSSKPRWSHMRAVPSWWQRFSERFCSSTVSGPKISFASRRRAQASCPRAALIQTSQPGSLKKPPSAPTAFSKCASARSTIAHQ